MVYKILEPLVVISVLEIKKKFSRITIKGKRETNYALLCHQIITKLHNGQGISKSNLEKFKIL